MNQSHLEKPHNQQQRIGDGQVQDNHHPLNLLQAEAIHRQQTP